MKKNNIKTLVMGFFATLFLVPQTFGAMRTSGPAPGAAESAPATSKKEDASSEFYGLSYALKNVDGFHFDMNLGITYEDRIWPEKPKVGADGVVKYDAIDSSMYVELSSRHKNEMDVVTLNKRDERSTITVFKDKKPESYTVVDPKGIYTATPSFCEILKTQTDSESFEAMAKTARTCRDFYARPGLDSSSKDEIQKHLDTHRRNLSLLKDSVAKPLVEAGEAAKKDPTKRWSNFWGLLSKGSKLPQPRAVLSKVPTGDESDDRYVIAELADACGRLWKSTKEAVKRPVKSNRSAPGKVEQ